MVIENILDHNKKTINRISNLYHRKNMSVKSIIDAYSGSISRPELIAILKYIGATELELKSNISSVNIEDSSFIVLGDTHLCSKYENLDYLYMVYEYAERYGIKHIFHTGDLIEGPINKRKEFDDVLKQAEYVIEKYPKSNATTHILFGNHDYQAADTFEDYPKILKSRNDFDLLGYKRCYFSVHNALYTLSHEIKNYNIYIPNICHVISFIGHSHECKVPSTDTIYTPTLSDDIKHLRNDNTPGFLSCYANQNNVTIFHYTCNGKNLECRGKILERKITSKHRK